MSIGLRLAVVFALASAVLFALGGWLFVSRLSASLKSTIDPSSPSSWVQAPRYLPACDAPAVGSGGPAPGEYVVQVVDRSGQVRGGSADAGTRSLLAADEHQQARRGRLLGDRSRTRASDSACWPAQLAGHPGWVAVVGCLAGGDRTRTLSHVTRELLVAGTVLVLVAGFGAYGQARAPSPLWSGCVVRWPSSPSGRMHPGCACRARATRSPPSPRP